MNQLNVSLENCYGIKKLETKFDFSQQKTYAIYAPNGAMKTSLAQTFKDIADATASKDRIFPARVCTRNITDDWKPNFFKDPKKRIASIPFIRNIIEYTKGDKDPNFIKLTSLLHWKDDSTDITQSDLDTIYKSVFGSDEASADGKAPVIDIIHHEANECIKAGDGINFENKIVLSIAVRIAAEQFMVKKINDATFVSSIDFNQTPKLLERFKQRFNDEVAIDIIQRVILMTPENIHVNSFMYEPILDMSDAHLRKLYKDVLALE